MSPSARAECARIHRACQSLGNAATRTAASRAASPVARPGGVRSSPVGPWRDRRDRPCPCLVQSATGRHSGLPARSRRWRRDQHARPRHPVCRRRREVDPTFLRPHVIGETSPLESNMPRRANRQTPGDDDDSDQDNSAASEKACHAAADTGRRGNGRHGFGWKGHGDRGRFTPSVVEAANRRGADNGPKRHPAVGLTQRPRRPEEPRRSTIILGHLRSECEPIARDRCKNSYEWFWKDVAETARWLRSRRIRPFARLRVRFLCRQMTPRLAVNTAVAHAGSGTGVKTIWSRLPLRWMEKVSPPTKADESIATALCKLAVSAADPPTVISPLTDAMVKNVCVVGRLPRGSR